MENKSPAASPALKAAMAAAIVGIPLTAGFEGLELKAYYDIASVPTICYGETLGVKITDTATKPYCDEMLKKRWLQFAMQVDAKVVKPMSPNTHAALTSFAYNVGMGSFSTSTLLRLMNAGDTVGACRQLPRWNKARVAGVLVPFPGLTNRRQAEMAICLEGLDVR